MGLFRRRRVERTQAGTYRLHLPEPERDLLGNLVEQLRDLLLETTDDPTVRRLFPTAYNEDPDRDQVDLLGDAVRRSSDRAGDVRPVAVLVDVVGVLA